MTTARQGGEENGMCPQAGGVWLKSHENCAGGVYVCFVVIKNEACPGNAPGGVGVAMTSKSS